MANLVANAWLGNESSLPDTDLFIDMLKNKSVYLTLPVILESFSGTSMLRIENRGGYKVISEIIMMCLTESGLQFDVQVPIQLLNISKKYYCLKKDTDGEDMILAEPSPKDFVYLIEEIKRHKLW